MEYMKHVVFQFFAFANIVHCANILGITTVMSHSHHIWNEILAEGLLTNGHNVTYLSPDPARIKHENYTVIEIQGIYDLVESSAGFEEPNGKQIFSASEFWSTVEVICSMDIKSDALKILDSYPKDYKFDAILWDVNAGQCLYPLIKRFGNPPVIAVSAYGIQTYISEMFGDHIHSYIPCSLAFTDRMSLWEKFQNTVLVNYVKWKRIRAMDAMRKKAMEYFGEDVDDFHQIEREFSIALVNSDAITNFPQALAPNIIPVAGLHIRKPKPIQQDIQRIINESAHGVIYFALGTNLKSEKVNKHVLDSFVNCFETLPQTILWKINGTAMQLPKNVKAFPWFSQNDILAHPKTVLFISHGGGLSTQEAMHRGVPIVGFPFFLDQMSNINRLVHRKAAEQIDYNKISSEYICSKIQQVLSEPRYRENMRMISNRVKDQQNSALERAVYWIEYVLRHKGAEHLSLAARDMTMFESLNLDLLLIALLLLTVIILVLLMSLKLVFAMLKFCYAKSIYKLKSN